MMTAINRDGSKFATLMVLGQTKLMPTQKIKILPTREMLFSTASVMKLDNPAASTVIVPCKTATGMNENMHPFPREEAIINTIIKSKIAFAVSVE